MKTRPQPSSFPTKRPEVRLKRLGDTGILLNLRTGDFFELDANALAVWTRLNGKTPAAAIAADLARRFGAPAKAIERDVRQFLSVLRRRRLIDGDA